MQRSNTPSSFDEDYYDSSISDVSDDQTGEPIHGSTSLQQQSNLPSAHDVHSDYTLPDALGSAHSNYQFTQNPIPILGPMGIPIPSQQLDMGWGLSAPGALAIPELQNLNSHSSQYAHFVQMREKWNRLAPGLIFGASQDTLNNFTKAMSQADTMLSQIQDPNLTSTDGPIMYNSVRIAHATLGIAEVALVNLKSELVGGHGISPQSLIEGCQFLDDMGEDIRALEMSLLGKKLGTSLAMTDQSQGSFIGETSKPRTMDPRPRAACDTCRSEKVKCSLPSQVSDLSPSERLIKKTLMTCENCVKKRRPCTIRNQPVLLSEIIHVLYRKPGQKKDSGQGSA